MEPTRVFYSCLLCKKWLSGIDTVKNRYVTNGKYWVVRDPSPGEDWESCCPMNDYNMYCNDCHLPRLSEGAERVIGNR